MEQEAQERIFRVSRWKAVVLLLGSLLLVAAGAWMVPEQPVSGGLCVLFFGLGIPLSLWMLRSDSVYLRLDPEGFEMGALWRRHRTRWADVQEFRLAQIRGHRLISVVYRPGYRQQRVGRALASALSGGMERAIGNHYDAPLDEILSALNAWRDRHGGELAPPVAPAAPAA